MVLDHGGLLMPYWTNICSSGDQIDSFMSLLKSGYIETGFNHDRLCIAVVTVSLNVWLTILAGLSYLGLYSLLYRRLGHVLDNTSVSIGMRDVLFPFTAVLIPLPDTCAITKHFTCHMGRKQHDILCKIIEIPSDPIRRSNHVFSSLDIIFLTVSKIVIAFSFSLWDNSHTSMIWWL